MIVIWSPTAATEFDECVNYITEKSSANVAKKWKNKIFKSFKTLEIFPKAGKKFGSQRERIWLPHKNYIAYYEIHEDYISIVRFRHSKRKRLEYKAK
jgi:plasmid stabilization system protein ParE